MNNAPELPVMHGDRLREIEALITAAARNSPDLVSALKQMCQQERTWSQDKITKEGTIERDSDFYRGYLAATKKLLYRLTKENYV